MLLYAVLFYYYLKGWHAANLDLNNNEDHRFISVIVPARNEEKNISGLLAALKLQSYPSHSFEVIVIDDFSTDATADIVKRFPLQNLSLTEPIVNSDHSSKKKAIEAGITKAKGELIVTTDADCIPPSGWLQAINDLYVQSDASFIAAPVKFTHDKSLLQTFQAIDFMTLQGITAASVVTGSLTMCNGANLAYTKKAFTEVKGYEGIDKVATGDDMLLMYKIWKNDPSRVFYLKKKEAIVITQPMKTWKELLMQRKRWASKTLIYDDTRIILVLGFVYLFNCFFAVVLVASFFDPRYWLLVAGYWLLKAVIEFPFVYSVARFYGEEKLLRSFFFLQPLHIFYTVFVGLVSQFGKYEWKGRRTK